MPTEGCRWGGAAVVLRGRESRPPGEGRQRKEQEVTVRSEDASVNTGAAGWPSYGQAYVAVRKIQNKLHCWAAADHGRRFDDLYNLVWDPTVLTMAWERVAGNMGARTAGVDRATVAWIVSRYGVETFPPAVRKIIYTTNSIASLNYQLRKIIKNRGHFPNDEAVVKLLWLAIRDIEDKRARERARQAGRPA